MAREQTGNYANPFLDDIARLELELESELEKRKPMTHGMYREMDGDIWSKLPSDILMLVLARIPTLLSAKFRGVCKRWSYHLLPSPTFLRISQTVVPCCSPAFLYGTVLHRSGNPVADKDLYLLQPVALSSRVYKLSLKFWFGRVVTSCKSLLCCCDSDYEAPTTSFYICNPVTKTWKKLPPATKLKRWDFIGLSFDLFPRRCLLIIGENSINQDRNNIEMEIYDSETNRWIQLEMRDMPLAVCPIGEGVFSRGRFYWIHRRINRLGCDVAEFNIVKKSWDVIKQPEIPHEPDHGFFKNSWQLSGHDGKVVLVYNEDLSWWKLEEDEKKEGLRWSELKAFPSSLCLEAVNRWRNCIGYQGSQSSPKVVVNSCGWVLVHIPRCKLVVFDDEGRLIANIKGMKQTILDGAYPLSYAYEVNNVWWPSL